MWVSITVTFVAFVVEMTSAAQMLSEDLLALARAVVPQRKRDSSAFTAIFTSLEIIMNLINIMLPLLLLKVAQALKKDCASVLQEK